MKKKYLKVLGILLAIRDDNKLMYISSDKALETEVYENETCTEAIQRKYKELGLNIESLDPVFITYSNAGILYFAYSCDLPDLIQLVNTINIFKLVEGKDSGIEKFVLEEIEKKRLK